MFTRIPAHRSGRRLSRLSPALLFLLLALTGLSADDSRRRYSVAAGDAADTLKRFAQQSGREIVYPSEQVRGVQTRAVEGEFTAVEVLTRMIEGTDLRVVQDAKSGALSVTRKSRTAGERDRSPSPSPSPTPAPTGNDSGEKRGERASGEVVELPAFSVHSARDDSYVGKEALSTTRTGVALLDLPQSVKVINRTMIDDINPSLIVDVLKYVGGGQAGNINFADDRFTMRGFNSPADIGDFVDGFRAKLDSNTDSAIIERLEIIKGPSAIFVANGPVGGVINKITKGPVSYDVRTLRLQAGLYDANRAELDLGGAISADGKLLYRLVVAGQDSDGWYDNTYTQRFLVAPSLSYVVSADTKFTLKYFYFDFRFASYNGIPFDLRTNAPLAVDPQTTFSEPKPLNWRTDKAHRVLGEFTHRFNSHVALRLAGFHTTNDAARVESVNGNAIPANFINGSLLARSTTAQQRTHERTHFQGDVVFTFDTGKISHRLLTGGELSDAPDDVAGFAGTSSSIDPMNPVFPGSVTVNWATPSGHTVTQNKQRKVFALETLNLFDSRLQLSLGGSRVSAKTSSLNKLTSATTPELSLTEILLQGGVVFKATPDVSLYYGYNENFAPNFQNGLVLPSQLGKQHELGVKAELVEGRLSASLAYFDIKQQNVPVLSFPQTTPPTFVLVPGQSSKGVDGDVTFKASPQLDFVATLAFLDAQARSQANSASPMIVNPVNNVAETTLGLWTRYKFTAGEVKGLSIGLGVSHLSKRAITTNNNATLYGYLDGFTVTDLVLGWERGPFRYSVNVNNLFDTDYYAAVRNQSIIVPGQGINVKAGVTWKF